jgi:hypothetical protein
MRLHTLRMAGIIGCSLVCVLLFALWARTFFACDSFSRNLAGGGEFIVTSRKNAIGFGFDQKASAPTRYYLRSVAPNTPPTFSYLEFLDFAYAGPISSGKFAFRVPYWFLTLVTLAVSRVLSKGHIWRFSLRTMLIATTLAAAAMGLTAYLSKR